MTKKILALTHGSPFDPHTFSGTNKAVLEAIIRSGIEVDACDIEIYGLPKYLVALQNLSIGRKKWAQNFRLSRQSYASKTKNAQQAIKEHQSDCDAILQMGGEFCSHNAYDLPVYSYHDNIAILSSLSKEYSFHSHATESISRSFIENEKKSLQGNTALFTFSHRVKNAMIEHYGIEDDKIHVVYAGINIDSSNLSGNVPDKYERQNILFVGKDFERKGGPDVLKAFKKLRTKFPDATLTIAGCELNIEEPGVNVVGFVDQRTPAGAKKMLDLYRNASVFTMPSIFEPFGIPYCEAMHFATPCVGSDTGAIPEIVDHGDTGLIVKAGNAEQLEQALCTILSDPAKAKAMGEKGKRKAIDNFTWDAVAQKMKAVFSEISK